ncbi:MAG: L,D-transpeptidase, partial [Pseudomonadota bacterium]
MTSPIWTRRAALTGITAAALAAPSLVSGQSVTPEVRESGPIARNASAFRNQDWRDHFKTLGKATIVADTQSRALHF